MQFPKLEIESCYNGFIVTIQECCDTDPHKNVYSFSIGENKCVVELLNDIKEYLGYYGSKHDKERVRVILQNNEEAHTDHEYSCECCWALRQ